MVIWFHRMINSLYLGFLWSLIHNPAFNDILYENMHHRRTCRIYKGCPKYENVVWQSQWLSIKKIILWETKELIITQAYMFAFAADVSQSAAKLTMSNPLLSWLKNRGWPVLTPYFSVSLQSTRICSSDSPSTGISKSKPAKDYDV